MTEQTEIEGMPFDIDVEIELAKRRLREATNKRAGYALRSLRHFIRKDQREYDYRVGFELQPAMDMARGLIRFRRPHPIPRLLRKAA